MTSGDKISAIDDITTMVLVGEISADEALELILLILTGGSDRIWH